MKKYFKLLFVVLAFSLVSFGLTSTSHATERPDTINVCQPEELIFEKGIKLYNLDIRRTVDNFITSLFITLFATLAGLNPDNVMDCETFVTNRLVRALASSSNSDIINMSEIDVANRCGTDYADSDTGENAQACRALVNSGMAFNPGGGNMASSVKARAVNSSMLGLSNMMEGFARNEPLPINMAFYWNESISKIPFVNKAFAAPSDAYNNLPMIKASYSMWKLSSRIAFGLISIVLLYTGIMIILRKKVNPQLVVSVQYAIPKIIIGILLILFSYPIGAVISSIGWGLFRGSNSLVFGALLGSNVGADFPMGILFLSLMLLTLRLAQGGFFYVLLLIIVSTILIALKIAIYFKALMIYMKMVFSIITAPLEMVLGTVPGSEDRIKDWFLRMAKYTLTLVAMGVIIPVTLVFALSILTVARTDTGSEFGGWGMLISLVVPLIIVIFGFSLGIGMEGKVDSMLFGAKKKK